MESVCAYGDYRDVKSTNSAPHTTQDNAHDVDEFHRPSGPLIRPAFAIRIEKHSGFLNQEACFCLESVHAPIP